MGKPCTQRPDERSTKFHETCKSHMTMSPEVKIEDNTGYYKPK
jgi:hypothetical protein